MKNRTAYAGIDAFRMIAALLVIAIHISPLTSVNHTADFILTRVIARVAVPFFFMASGFFLFPQAEDVSAKRLIVFIKKTGILYAAAILLYLPLNLYHGVPKEWASITGLLKDIFFDGTYLHLWYLPAAMLGAAISWALLRCINEKGALVIVLGLYLIGLLGDSYYGIAEKTPEMKAFYQAVFAVSGYTRNGLFFAPVFFILGARIARRPDRDERKFCVMGLGISIALMIAEGLLLNGLGVQRHDSMYLLLPVCMVFLFRSLLFWKGRNNKRLRNISAAVYIVHPLVMVLVYKFAVITDLRWLTDNSMVRFFAVAIVSLVFAVLLSVFLRRIQSWKTSLCQGCMDRAWVEISLKDLQHNAAVIQKTLPEGCEIMAVVKANAYGHGDVEVSKALSRVGIKAFAVATIDEGIHLRKRGVRGEILVLGYTNPRSARTLSKYRLSQTVVDAQYARELSGMGKKLRVHLKVDTGMHRLGERYDHAQEIAQVFDCPRLRVSGIFTHLCVSDSNNAEDVAFTGEQIQRFYDLLEELKKRNIPIPKIHVQSSYGVLNYPEMQCDYARVGIALYGAVGKTKQDIDLKPVLSLKASVALVRTIAAGESVGYGREFVAQRETQMAVLPIGYSDGVPRNFEGSYALLQGSRAPIIGRICMDQLMIDVTDIPGVKRGDIATLIGRDGMDEISAVQAAANAGTIPNEVLSRLSGRLERVYR